MEQTNAAKPPNPGTLGLLGIAVRAGVAGLTTAVTSPFSRPQSLSYKRDVLYAALRAAFDVMHAEQQQYMSPSTEEAYVTQCQKWKFEPDTEEIDYGAKLHWIGPRNKSYVLLYFHGGGYMAPMGAVHWNYMKKIQKQMEEKGLELSIAVLNYTLTPHARFPGQLRQAVSALRHLLEKEKRSPSTIVVGGDSAGGNLAAALLLHIQAPVPEVDVLNLPSRLLAAMLLSPWISFDPKQPSFVSNARTDYLTPGALLTAHTKFSPPGYTSDHHVEPVLATPEVWKDVSQRVTRSMFVWGGMSEILADSITEFGTKIKTGFAQNGAEHRVNLVLTPNEGHEEMITDDLFKLGDRVNQGGIAVQAWLAETLTNASQSTHKL
ncbi:Alpha/Beta hydrolase protein [Pyrenochaeta sp. MPI-SDFR-AT-0127]|nr:Alpha/Beta hydrolase protein [Pyrenochaeta sp. MPI-SDFR-AT-0127]